MKKTGILLLLLLAFTEIKAQTNAITTFILIRHAEKGDDGTKDPDLLTSGNERAERLVQLLKEASVSAIYSTNFKRTQNTVRPLATAKGLIVQPYVPFKNEEIEAMIKKHAGGTIVMVGHSNTIPWTANLLIGKEAYKDFEDSDYNNFLIVSVAEKGKAANVTWLNY